MLMSSKCENENAEQHVDHSNRSVGEFLRKSAFFLFLFVLRQVSSHVQSQMITSGERTLANRAFELFVGRENVKIETDDDLKFMKMSEKNVICVATHWLSSGVFPIMSRQLVTSCESPLALGPLTRIRLLA